jgi:hypothetical protein
MGKVKFFIDFTNLCKFSYLDKKEMFKEYLRKLFPINTIIVAISNYYRWKMSSDAGMATAGLNFISKFELYMIFSN